MDQFKPEEQEENPIKKFFRALVRFIQEGLKKQGFLNFITTDLTFEWLKQRLKGKMDKTHVNKVAMVEIEKLAAECGDTISLSDLKALGDFCIAEIDANGEVWGELEFIKDSNPSLDKKVDELLKKERMVVVH